MAATDVTPDNQDFAPIEFEPNFDDLAVLDTFDDDDEDAEDEVDNGAEDDESEAQDRDDEGEEGEEEDFEEDEEEEQEDEDGDEEGEESEEEGEGDDDESEQLAYGLGVLEQMGLADFGEEGAPKSIDALASHLENGRMALYKGLRNRIGGAAAQILDAAVQLKGNVPPEQITEIITGAMTEELSEADAESFLRERYKASNLTDDLIEQQIASLKENKGVVAQARSIKLKDKTAEAEVQAERSRERATRIEAEFDARSDWKPEFRDAVKRDWRNGKFVANIQAVLGNDRDMVLLAAALQDYDPAKGLDLTRFAQAAKTTGRKSKANDLKQALRKPGKSSKARRNTVKRSNEEEFVFLD